MNEALKKQKQRVVWVDLAKFWGIVAIVYGHTVQGGMTNRYVYSFHVPLFFFLLGVVFSITHAERKNFGQFVKNKLFTLLIPYYVFAVISTVVIFVASRFIPSSKPDMYNSVMELIINILIGDCDANSPLWFLPCTFVISIMAYGIIRLIHKIQKKKYKWCALLAFAAIGCAALFFTEAFTTIRFWVYKVDGAVFMLPFFLAGYAMQEFLCFEKMARWPLYLRVLCIAALLLLGGGVGALNGRSTYLGNYYDNVGAMYIAAMATSIGVCLLVQMVPLWSVPAYVGQHTLGILLMHKFPVLLFQVGIPFTAKQLEHNSVLIGVVVTAISIVLCCGVETIIVRICPILIGKKKQKKIK